MLRQYLHQLLPFKNCRHYADFIILEMLWWRFWKRQSGEFCIVCNWILCFCIRYRNAAITEHGSLSRDNLFCSSRIVHPYRRNQPWFQAYTSVCPRGARRENRPFNRDHTPGPYLVLTWELASHGKQQVFVKAKGYVYIFWAITRAMTRPFACWAITWPVARLAIACFMYTAYCLSLQCTLHTIMSTASFVLVLVCIFSGEV